MFDGYDGTPSTKDHEHGRRATKKCPVIKVRNNTSVTVSQQLFMTNNENKAELIKLITPQFRKDKHIVKQAEADADTMIVSTALDFAASGKTVCVYANDTDIIVMLLYHWKDSLANIFVKSDSTFQGHRQQK